MTTNYATPGQLTDYLGLTSSQLTDLNITATMLSDALDRRAQEIDERTKTHFTVAGTANPDYVVISNEKKDGQGKFNRAYYPDRYPLPKAVAYASGTISPSGSTVDVVNAAGFPASGVIGTGVNKIAYTGMSGTAAFTGCTGISGTILPNDEIVPYVVEISTSDSGDAIDWQVMQKDTEYDLMPDTGRVTLYKNYIISSYYAKENPPNYTPNRFRISYCYGWDKIPAEITRACLMIASKDLMHMIVRRGTLAGLNSFNPTMINVDEEYIGQVLMRYQNPMFTNT